MSQKADQDKDRQSVLTGTMSQEANQDNPRQQTTGADSDDSCCRQSEKIDKIQPKIFLTGVQSN